MSFSFSFSGDDIEEDTLNDPSETITTTLQNTTLDPTPPTPVTIPPKKHTLSDLLQSLPDQLSYNYLDVPLRSYDTGQDGELARSGSRGAVRTIRIPRRSLFDIRQQLMHESDVDSASDPAPAAEPDRDRDSDRSVIVTTTATTDEAGRTAHLLSGLETGDLSTGVYEGGFKTWECAIDLAAFVDERVAAAARGEEGRVRRRAGEWHVIELGAGSAVPSLVLLQRVLAERRAGEVRSAGGLGEGKVRFTLCDYNEDVLRLCTGVNVFLTIVTAMSLEQYEVRERGGQDADEDEGDIEVDEGMVQECLATLRNANIEVDFISGAWGDEFVELLREPKESAGESKVDERKDEVLVLASETIYEPKSLEVFSKTVINILNTAQDRGKAEAYVAAKKVYFGVGGGVAEFEEEVRKIGGGTKTVLDVEGAGVGRVVLDIVAR